ncbi:PadR family transcriptional regulator [Aestuariimicrobium ganziense]|uniref:PadR family transcriptional regulator n=1 Tax=Aestuariimicrobium ganziense TaxID=2773677 RepID=UPI0019415BCF|nr:PadR family transcriptional regulator [Aestuariimicrobium ganziense]
MSIRQSLLALLSEQPRHGYELKAEFDRRTGHSWPLNIGQVYSTLERLERDGLVVRGDEDDDGRVVHSITTDGRREVQAWFANPVVLDNPPRNELAIKIAIASSMPAVDLTALVQVQRRASIATLQDYTRARRAADPDDLAWHLVIESMIHQTEAEVRWLDHCENAALRASHRARAARTARAAAAVEPQPTPPATTNPLPASQKSPR